jgi:branched-chain amino acid transport system permease protein
MIETLLIFIAIYAILALSLNLTVGRAGLFNLGHIGFYAIGSYVSTLLVMELELPWLLSLTAGGFGAALAGYGIGLLTLKLSGDYFAIATLGFATIVKGLILNLQDLTRGPLGVTGIPRPELLGYALGKWERVLLLLLCLGLTWLVLGRLGRSPWGRLVRAVRDDEIASRALGKHTLQVKAQAVAISAFFAGVAGALYASQIRYIHPNVFTTDLMIFILVGIIFGGLGNQWGAVLGAALLTTFQQGLLIFNVPPSLAGPLQQIIYSVALIAMMILRPQGLVPEGVLRSKGGLSRAAD